MSDDQRRVRVADVARDDYEETDDSWRKNVLVSMDDVGSMLVSTRTVDAPSEAVQEALDAGYELDYHQLE